MVRVRLILVSCPSNPCKVFAEGSETRDLIDARAWPTFRVSRSPISLRNCQGVAREPSAACQRVVVAHHELADRYASVVVLIEVGTFAQLRQGQRDATGRPVRE